MNTPLLHLSADTVRRALPMREALEAMRGAFAQLARGEVTLPTRLRLDAPAEHGAALIMPCHSTSQKHFSLNTVFHDKAPAKAAGKPQELTAIAYYAWANRSKNEKMTVWLPTSD
ncbi:MAG: hypothetical protein NTZ09_20415 [Candidatus Hydrogenedentes bacterium]|nr:hypothetical protein [Candidatus Hydrogenedentota bacterium]